MKKLLSILLFTLGSVIGFGQNGPVNAPVIDGVSDPEVIPTKRVTCDYDIAQKLKPEINLTLKENLRGIWVSDEYRDALFKNNSVTKALKEYQFYTDVVFDQDSVLHCARPDYMEEAYIVLQPDSTLVDIFSGSLASRIVLVENDKLVIQDLNGRNHSLTRVRKESNPENVTMDVWEGHHIVENKWLMGEYVFESKSTSFDLILNEDGSVVSNKNITEVSVYSNEADGFDILYFRYSDETYKTYILESFTVDGILLREMKQLEVMDEPIKPLKRTVTLKRRTS